MDYYTNAIADDMQIIVQRDGSTVELPNISFVAYGENAEKQLASAIIKEAGSYLEESGNGRSALKSAYQINHLIPRSLSYYP